jgi:hypothetical protein
MTGRELALTARGAGEEGRTFKTGLYFGLRDGASVTIGFFISLIIALNINPVIGENLWGKKDE